MPPISIAGNMGVVEEVGTLRSANEAHLDRIDKIASPIKHLWPLLNWLQKVPQGRHGAIVQVRSSRPNSIQWKIAITIRFSIGVKFERRIVNSMEFLNQRGGERLQTM